MFACFLTSYTANMCLQMNCWSSSGIRLFQGLIQHVLVPLLDYVLNSCCSCWQGHPVKHAANPAVRGGDCNQPRPAWQPWGPCLEGRTFGGETELGWARCDLMHAGMRTALSDPTSLAGLMVVRGRYKVCCLARVPQIFIAAEGLHIIAYCITLQKTISHMHPCKCRYMQHHCRTTRAQWSSSTAMTTSQRLLLCFSAHP